MTKDEKRAYDRQRYLRKRGDILKQVAEYKRTHRDAAYAIIKRWGREHRYNYLDLEHYKWEDVEGYDGWTTNVEVHHRREGIGYTRAQLIEQGQYYNCRADELICLTKAEHTRLHHEIDKFFNRNNKEK